MTVLLAYLAAAGGMMLYGVASVLQAFAARRASGSAIMRHPAYLAGMCCDGLAWVLSLLALSALPLFVVQSLLAGSLAVTMILAALVLRIRLGRRHWIAIAVVSIGLVAVGLSSGAESTARPPSWFTSALVTAAVGLVLGAAVTYRRRTPLGHAITGGLGFSGAALAARAVASGTTDWPRILAAPSVWAMLAMGAVGAVMYARALEVGSVGPVTAALWVVEVVVPGALGVLVLGDGVRRGLAPLAIAGVAVAVAGCVMLAHSQTQQLVAAQPHDDSTP